MVKVCAWCQRFMGLKEPLEEPVVTHGICGICSLRQQLGEMPTVVIAREQAHALPVFEGLLTGSPEIRVVVDRRQGERRRGTHAPGRHADRRRADDRRQGVAFRVA